MRFGDMADIENIYFFSNFYLQLFDLQHRIQSSLLQLDLFYVYVTVPGTTLFDCSNIEGSFWYTMKDKKCSHSRNAAPKNFFFVFVFFPGWQWFVDGGGGGQSLDDSGVPEGNPLHLNSQVVSF